MNDWTCSTTTCRATFTPTEKEIGLKQEDDRRQFFCDNCRKKMVDERVMRKMGYVKK